MISDEAVDAAWAEVEAGILPTKADIQRILDAAAPHMLREALYAAAGMIESLPFDAKANAAFAQQLIAKQMRIRATSPGREPDMAPHMLADSWDEGAAAGLACDENRETEFVAPKPYRSQA